MAAAKMSIATGFKEDCLQLLSLFQDGKDIRFGTFCECWQKMKFSLVFMCRESFAELLEFCEEALHIAKQFCLQPYTFKERIGGLYLLYGMYYKMPLEDLTKIRLTLSDFVQLMDLHNQIREGEHYDANYILAKLFFDNAFSFCLFNKEMGLQKQKKKHRKQSTDNSLSLLRNICNMNKPFGIFEKVNLLSKEYADQKKAYAECNKNERVPQLYDCDIVDSIMADFHRIDELRNAPPVIYDKDIRKKKDPPVSKARRILGHGFDTDSSENEFEEKNVDDIIEEKSYLYK